LSGGTGKDELTGDTGSDHFVFDVKLKKSNVDTITDFEVNQDVFVLDRTYFKGIGGKLNKSEFEIGKKADDNKDRIIYDDKTGKLYHDRNGDKPGKMKLFAITDKHLKIDHHDFDMIA
jgi:Ca2+-binding RTX toxin-like protein